jgi:16S rRNA (guanine527-N7)-methyltransferase
MFHERHFNEINNITDVSRETFSDIVKFSEQIIRWNNSINLVSKKTLSPEELWSRHILDSVQLIKYLPKDAGVITDLGSGGGFPAIILAIVSKEDRRIHLVESDQKKCAFLIDMAGQIRKNVTIHNQRIEDVAPWETDVLTSRALAPLENLLEFSKMFHVKHSISLFLKGGSVASEIAMASKRWDLEYDIYPSITSEDGSVVKVTKYKNKV